MFSKNPIKGYTLLPPGGQFEMKESTGDPQGHFLGANIERNEKAGGKLTFGSGTYITKILENYQRMFGKLPKHFKYPMEPGDQRLMRSLNLTPMVSRSNNSL